MEARMAAEESDSPFLSLPGEIRNSIYEHCFAGQDTIVLSTHGILPPPLANVCHQVRQEYMSVHRSQRFDFKKIRVIKARVENLHFQRFARCMSAIRYAQRNDISVLGKIHTVLAFTDPTAPLHSQWLDLASEPSISTDPATLRLKEVARTYTVEFDWEKFDLERALVPLASRTSAGFADADFRATSEAANVAGLKDLNKAILEDVGSAVRLAVANREALVDPGAPQRRALQAAAALVVPSEWQARAMAWQKSAERRARR